MASHARALTKPILRQNSIVSYPGIGAVIEASRRTRPLWFDGRFLAAHDMQRDQNYFLARQAALGRAAGFGVIHGLSVERVSINGQAPDADTIVIRAGQGITPSGQMVMLSADLTIRISDLPDEENLNEQFGLSETPIALQRTRTGLYVIALRPVEFTANPIASYPTSLQGSPTTHDGSVVEAVAVSLVPYANPASNYDASTQNAAVARQIFVTGNSGTLSNSLLPLAMISIERDAIGWVDPYLVRRDSGPEFNGIRFGLADPAAQQAFLLQYDAQLQQVVSSLAAGNLPAHFAATEYFQALPPSGRLPLASIDVSALTQLFFPQQTDVTLSLIPQDELPAWIEDGSSLPPIDLTLPASAYADLSVFILIPVPRASYAAQASTLPPTGLTAAVPQALSYRNPVSVLRFYQGPLTSAATSSSGWSAAIGVSIYGYYVRRRSSPIFAAPSNATTTVATLSAIGSDSAGITLTATILPSAATGSVTFSDGKSVLGTVALTSGVATLVLQQLAPGTHSLTVSYPGDATFSGSFSNSLNYTVSGHALTTTTLSAVTTGSGPTAVVTLKAAVSPSPATGLVTFSSGTTVVGIAAVAAGVATLAINPAPGKYSVTASYMGDNNFAGSLSNQVSYSVATAATTLTLSLGPPGTVGLPLIATVSSPKATGSITFKNGATVLGTATLASGVATWVVPISPTVSYSFAASYGGDANFAGSGSNTLPYVGA